MDRDSRASSGSTSRYTRRQILKAGGALAAGSVAAPWLVGCNTGETPPRGSLTVAAVNNPQMEDMESLLGDFEKKTGITASFQFMLENDLRQKVTEDVSRDAGDFDVVMISSYETPLWGRSRWLEPLDPYFERLDRKQRGAYDLGDILGTWRTSLAHEGRLYSIPFYGESSAMFYRQDLFEKAGLRMPERPTWDEVAGFAEELHDPAGGTYGITLRGLPGWGANVAPFATFMNTYGGRWYDEDWQPQLTSPEVGEAIEAYAKLATQFAQPGITSDNFPECLTLFSDGDAAMWYDATVAGGLVSDADSSQVADRVGFAHAPTAVTPRGSHWLWCWSLGIGAASKNKADAFEFIRWATGKDYVKLVGEKLGYGRVPPGTRRSTYEETPYGENAWTDLELTSIETADPTRPTRDPVPYTGIQYIVIPEFQKLGDAVGTLLAGVLNGDLGIEEMQKRAQEEALRVARQGGYQKG